MQIPPNYQQYPQNYQPYPVPRRSGGAGIALGIIALVIAIAALILSLVFGLGGAKSSEATFRVDNFSVDKSTTDYSYNSYIYYDGTGDVLTTDRDNAYLVVLKVDRTSGGSGYGDDVTYQIVDVVDGKGKFYTYDSGYLNAITKPTYDFTIVGSVKLDQPKEK